MALKTMRCKSGLTRPVIMYQGLGPLGVHMEYGGEGSVGDDKRLFWERGFPETEAFGMDLE